MTSRRSRSHSTYDYKYALKRLDREYEREFVGISTDTTPAATEDSSSAAGHAHVERDAQESGPGSCKLAQAFALILILIAM